MRGATEVIYVRIPVPLKERLHREAQAHFRSLTSQVVEILAERYQEDDSA